MIKIDDKDMIIDGTTLVLLNDFTNILLNVKKTILTDNKGIPTPMMSKLFFKSLAKITRTIEDAKDEQEIVDIIDDTRLDIEFARIAAMGVVESTKGANKDDKIK